jgi:hypothetical protein
MIELNQNAEWQTYRLKPELITTRQRHATDNHATGSHVAMAACGVPIQQ